LGQHGEDDEEVCGEDCAAAAEEGVYRIGGPGRKKAKEGWGGVDYADKPGAVGDAEFAWEGEVGAVGAGVVPASVEVLVGMVGLVMMMRLSSLLDRRPDRYNGAAMGRRLRVSTSSRPGLVKIAYMQVYIAHGRSHLSRGNTVSDCR
jgi:hypothetical protein